MSLSVFAQKWARKTIVFSFVIFIGLPSCYEREKAQNQTKGQANANFLNYKSGEEQRVQVQGNAIVALLHKENLIQDKGNLSYKITHSAFFINAVKQSRQLHQKIIQQYVKNSGTRLHYTYGTSTNAD